MDGVNYDTFETMLQSYDEGGLASELIGWFSVSGDMDDFIFYGDDSGYAMA